jgi:hypothetical protein
MVVILATLLEIVVHVSVARITAKLDIIDTAAMLRP